MKLKLQKAKAHLTAIWWGWIKQMGFTVIAAGIFVLAVIGLQVLSNFLGIFPWSVFLIAMFLCLAVSAFSHFHKR